MTRYPVGTRVRMIASDRQPHMIGAEGTILGPASEQATILLYPREAYTVNFPTHQAYDGTTEWYTAHDDLEPIQTYDGNQTTTWEKCLWQPDGVKA